MHKNAFLAFLLCCCFSTNKNYYSSVEIAWLCNFIMLLGLPISHSLMPTALTLLEYPILMLMTCQAFGIYSRNNEKILSISWVETGVLGVPDVAGVPGLLGVPGVPGVPRVPRVPEVPGVRKSTQSTRSTRSPGVRNSTQSTRSTLSNLSTRSTRSTKLSLVPFFVHGYLYKKDLLAHSDLVY
jgi:hypothetical protein